MSSDDRNGLGPTADRPFRVLVIAGSDRRQYNCPGGDSREAAEVDQVEAQALRRCSPSGVERLHGDRR